MKQQPSSICDENILKILEKDFQELTNQEIQVLRNLHSHKFGTQGKIPNIEIFTLYLKEKRKKIIELERLLVAPIDHISKKEFGIINFAEVCTIPILKAPNGPQNGIISIRHPIILPLLTIFYNKDYEEAWCLTSSGDFCCIKSTDFQLKVI